MRRVNRTGIKKDITKEKRTAKRTDLSGSLYIAMENLKTKPITLTLKKGGSWKFCKCENFPYIQLS